jgi:hypothetical protein
MAAVQTRDAPAQTQATYTIKRRNRHWAVIDPAGALVCLTVYKRGAEEVVRRLGS